MNGGDWRNIQWSAHEPPTSRRNKTFDLCVASVYGVAAQACDGGGDSKTLAGDAGFAFSELRQINGGVAGYGYFCGGFAAPRTIEGGVEVEVDSLDRGGGGAIELPGA